jgi:hypothetical protein
VARHGAGAHLGASPGDGDGSGRRGAARRSRRGLGRPIRTLGRISRIYDEGGRFRSLMGVEARASLGQEKGRGS